MTFTIIENPCFRFRYFVEVLRPDVKDGRRYYIRQGWRKVNTPLWLTNSLNHAASYRFRRKAEKCAEEVMDKYLQWRFAEMAGAPPTGGKHGG